MERRNVVYIQNVDLGNNRATPYHFSIKSWKAWCEKNDVTFFEMTEPLYDPKELHINIQKWWAQDVVEANIGQVSQIAVVDADTIIHPDAPNFFNQGAPPFGVVRDNGSYEWILRSIEGWGKLLFPEDPRIKIWKYWNSGFVRWRYDSRIDFIKPIQDYFLEHAERIERNRRKVLASNDQTICNYILQKESQSVDFLDECWNLQHMFKKDLLHVPNYSWWSDELHFLNAGWVYHFNGIPQGQPRDINYWMERTYKQLYG